MPVLSWKPALVWNFFKTQNWKFFWFWFFSLKTWTEGFVIFWHLKKTGTGSHFQNFQKIRTGGYWQNQRIAQHWVLLEHISSNHIWLLVSRFEQIEQGWPLTQVFKIRELGQRTYPKLLVLSWKLPVLWFFFPTPKPEVHVILENILKTETGGYMILKKNWHWLATSLILKNHRTCFDLSKLGSEKSKNWVTEPTLQTSSSVPVLRNFSKVLNYRFFWFWKHFKKAKTTGGSVISEKTSDPLLVWLSKIIEPGLILMEF